MAARASLKRNRKANGRKASPSNGLGGAPDEVWLRWMKKIATAQEVAAQVVALTSSRISGHVTGQVITVAGGMEGRVIDV